MYLSILCAKSNFQEHGLHQTVCPTQQDFSRSLGNPQHPYKLYHHQLAHHQFIQSVHDHPLAPVHTSLTDEPVAFRWRIVFPRRWRFQYKKRTIQGMFCCSWLERGPSFGFSAHCSSSIDFIFVSTRHFVLQFKRQNKVRQFLTKVATPRCSHFTQMVVMQAPRQHKACGCVCVCVCLWKNACKDVCHAETLYISKD